MRDFHASLDPKRFTARQLIWVHEKLNSDDDVERDFALYLWDHYGMPKILDKAVQKIKARGASESSAYAIATAALQKAGDLKKGHNTPTKKGVKRGAMSAAQRAATRK